MAGESFRGVEAPPPTLGSDPASRAAGGAAGDRPPRAHRPFSRPARRLLPPPPARRGGARDGRRALDPSQLPSSPHCRFVPPGLRSDPAPNAMPREKER